MTKVLQAHRVPLRVLLFPPVTRPLPQDCHEPLSVAHEGGSVQHGASVLDIDSASVVSFTVIMMRHVPFAWLLPSAVAKSGTAMAVTHDGAPCRCSERTHEPAS